MLDDQVLATTLAQLFARVDHHAPEIIRRFAAWANEPDKRHEGLLLASLLEATIDNTVALHGDAEALRLVLSTFHIVQSKRAPTLQ